MSEPLALQKPHVRAEAVPGSVVTVVPAIVEGEGVVTTLSSVKVQSQVVVPVQLAVVKALRSMFCTPGQPPSATTHVVGTEALPVTRVVMFRATLVAEMVTRPVVVPARFENVSPVHAAESSGNGFRLSTHAEV